MARRRAGSGYTGVEIRESGSIRIRVPYRGGWVYEPLDIKATTAGKKEAARIRQQVIERSRIGDFDWCQFFPSSPRCVQAESEVIPRFDELAETFIENCTGQRYSVSTIKGYRKVLNNVWSPEIGNMDVDLIRKSDIRRVINKRNWQSAKTFANALSPMKGVFALAVEDEWIVKSPAIGFKAPKWQKPPPDPLTADERSAVLESMDPDYLNYFEFAFGCGMRPSEIMALKWGSLDFVNGLISVSEARVEGVDKGTKSHETRVIPMMPMVKRALLRQRAVSQLHSEYVFPHPGSSRPFTDEQPPRKAWNAALKKAGIRHRKAYSTRHTFATLLLMAREPIERISKWLGHRSPQVTYDHYAKWMESPDTKPSPGAMDALS